MTKYKDCIDTLFEIPELTNIHGRPTYNNVKIVEDGLKTNGSTVTSSLGGVRNVHVSLVATV